MYCVLRYTHLWARRSISVATRGGEVVPYFPTNGEDHHPDPVKRRERGCPFEYPPSQLLAMWSNELWPHVANHDTSPLTACEGHCGGYVLLHAAFSNKCMPCEALSASVRRFRFMWQFICWKCKLLLEVLWEPESSIPHSSAICKRSVRLSEALQAVFSLNVNLYVTDANYRYKSADSLWEHFYVAAWM